MTVNVELLKQEMEAVRAAARKGTWRQEVYRYQSGMCFAGHLVEQAGGVWLRLPNSRNFWEYSDYLVPTQGEIADGVAYLIGDPDNPGEYVYATHARKRAQALLGLSADQADALFDGSNEMDDLEEMVRLLSEGPPRQVTWPTNGVLDDEG